MPHFTLEFHRAIELTGGRIEFPNDPANRSGHTRAVGGSIDFDHYPIFDELYRRRLNGLILDRYYNQEIAHETVNLFQLAFRRHMNETMPYYNKMYTAEQTHFDPLSTIDLRTITESTSQQETGTEGSSASANLTGGKSRSVYSDLPQTMLAGSGDYASNATDANSQSEATAEATEQTQATTEAEAASESRVTGYQGNPGLLLAEYRESLANVDIMVLESLEPLFMEPWQSGNSYSMGDFGGFTYPVF